MVGSDPDNFTSRRRGGRACLMARGEGRQARPLRGWHHRGWRCAEPTLNTRLFEECRGRARTERPVGRILVRTMWPPHGVTHALRERQLRDEDRTCGSDPRIPE